MKIIPLSSQIYLLEDKAEYFSTLVIGKKRALLWDLASGLEDLLATVNSLTKLPLLVIASHGHFDHLGGAYQFERVYLDSKDKSILDSYEDDWLNSWLKEIDPEHEDHHFASKGWNNVVDLDFASFDLGDLKGEIIPLPGHTLGSIGVYFPSLRCLLSGDALLPISSLIFKNHGSLEELKSSIQKAESLDIDYFLTSHSDHKIAKSVLKKMKDGIEHYTSSRPVKYHFPKPPYGDGYFYVYSIDEEPVGLIIKEKI